jgi:hypothetical protein
MREIRTYGLKRGRWPVRLARRAGVYSTVEMLADSPRRRVEPAVGSRPASRFGGEPPPRLPALGRRRLSPAAP